MQSAQIAQQVAPQEQPQMAPPPPPELPVNGMDLSGLLNYGQQQLTAEQQEDMKRKQLLQQYSSSIGRF